MMESSEHVKDTLAKKINYFKSNAYAAALEKKQEHRRDRLLIFLDLWKRFGLKSENLNPLGHQEM